MSCSGLVSSGMRLRRVHGIGERRARIVCRVAESRARTCPRMVVGVALDKPRLRLRGVPVAGVGPVDRGHAGAGPCEEGMVVARRPAPVPAVVGQRVLARDAGRVWFPRLWSDDRLELVYTGTGVECWRAHGIVLPISPPRDYDADDGSGDHVGRVVPVVHCARD